MSVGPGDERSEAGGDAPSVWSEWSAWSPSPSSRGGRRAPRGDASGAASECGASVRTSGSRRPSRRGSLEDSSVVSRGTSASRRGLATGRSRRSSRRGRADESSVGSLGSLGTSLSRGTGTSGGSSAGDSSADGSAGSDAPEPEGGRRLRGKRNVSRFVGALAAFAALAALSASAGYAVVKDGTSVLDPEDGWGASDPLWRSYERGGEESDAEVLAQRARQWENLRQRLRKKGIVPRDNRGRPPAGAAVEDAAGRSPDESMGGGDRRLELGGSDAAKRARQAENLRQRDERLAARDERLTEREERLRNLRGSDQRVLPQEPPSPQDREGGDPSKHREGEISGQEKETEPMPHPDPVATRVGQPGKPRASGGGGARDRRPPPPQGDRGEDPPAAGANSRGRASDQPLGDASARRKETPIGRPSSLAADPGEGPPEGRADPRGRAGDDRPARASGGGGAPDRRASPIEDDPGEEDPEGQAKPQGPIGDDRLAEAERKQRESYRRAPQVHNRRGARASFRHAARQRYNGMQYYNHNVQLFSPRGPRGEARPGDP